MGWYTWPWTIGPPINHSPQKRTILPFPLREIHRFITFTTSTKKKKKMKSLTTTILIINLEELYMDFFFFLKALGGKRKKHVWRCCAQDVKKNKKNQNCFGMLNKTWKKEEYRLANRIIHICSSVGSTLGILCDGSRVGRSIQQRGGSTMCVKKRYSIDPRNTTVLS